MTTTIVNPAAASSGGMDHIDQAFSRINSLFGPISGGGQGAFGVSPQPVSGADNSLTAYFRGLSNLAGTAAPGLLQQGQGVLGTGLDVTGTGLQTMQPSIDFYQKLLSGDPTATTAALAPTAANIAQITAGATDQASRGMPGGGYRAATLAGLPFSQAAQVGNAALQLQPEAAKELGQLGGEQAQLGLNLGQLGTILSGQGMQGLQNTIQDMMQKMGINIQGGTANLFSTVVSSL